MPDANVHYWAGMPTISAEMPREDVRVRVTLRHYGLRRCLLKGGCLWAVEVELPDGSALNLGNFDRLPDANSAIEQFIRDTEDIQ